MSVAAAPLNDLEPAGCYDELVDLLDSVRIARGLSFQRLDELSGLASDHAQKALGPARVKTLSAMMLDALLPTLGVRLVAVDDQEAIAAIEHRWERRDEQSVRLHTRRVSRRLLDRARPVILQELIENLTTAAAAATEDLQKRPSPKAQKPAQPPLPPRLVREQPATPSRQNTGNAHLHVIQTRHKGARWGGAL
jgi:hypothetical protein